MVYLRIERRKGKSNITIIVKETLVKTDGIDLKLRGINVKDEIKRIENSGRLC